MSLLKNKSPIVTRFLAPLLVVSLLFGLCVFVVPQHASAASSLDCNSGSLTADNCGIIKYLRNFIRVLSAMVGLVVVIMIAYGGLRYTASRDSPQQTADAKSHIVNAIFALLIYIFVVAGLNWAIPGGVF